MKKKADSIYEEIAIKILTDGSLEDKLRFWWCSHYKRPFLDPLLEKYTIEQLLVEYYATLYQSNPQKLKDKERIDKAKEKGRFIDEEEWFKREMGDDYIAEGETIKDEEVKDIDINF